MSKYIYPAIFVPEEGKYDIEFPDLPGCSTCGDDLQDALNMAKDALALMLTDMEDNREEIPEASLINSLDIPEGAFATLISCDTMQYRRLLNNIAVKKTLTIPAWLNDAASAAGLNFSQVLKSALIRELGLEN